MELMQLPASMADHNLGPSIFRRDKGPSKDEQIQALEAEYAELSKKVEFITGEHVDLLSKHAALQKICAKTVKDLDTDRSLGDLEHTRL